jgi:hypothetical protein
MEVRIVQRVGLDQVLRKLFSRTVPSVARHVGRLLLSDRQRPAGDGQHDDVPGQRLEAPVSLRRALTGPDSV